MRKNDQSHYKSLAAILGETAPIDDDFEYTFADGTFDSRRQRGAAEALKLTGLAVSIYVGAAAYAENPGVAGLFARLAASESQHHTYWVVARGGSPIGTRAAAPALARSRQRRPRSLSAMRRLALPALAAALLASAAIGATASRSDAAPAKPAARSAQLTVLAAASLREVLPQIDGTQRYSFAGSDALATQIRNGIGADLFLSANTSLPNALYNQGLIAKPVIFATNRLVIIVPASNPANLRSVWDLKKPGIKLIIGQRTVPIGSYTRQVLSNMGISAAVLRNVVSQERDVAAITAKVALGEADAGLAYVTDAKAVADKVKTVGIPVWAQPKVRYGLGVISKSANKADARALIAKITSKRGRALLVKAGFGVPALPKKGK